MGRARTAGPALAAAPRARAFTVGQITVATLIGTPLAGCLLLALNAEALGRPERRDPIIGWGLLVTIAAMGIAFALPEGIPNLLLPALYTLGTFQTARRLQGRAIAVCRAETGGRRSHLVMLALAIACHVVVAATCISILSLATHGRMVAPIRG